MKQADFRDEYQRHQRARHENRPLLEGRLDEIQKGEALDALEPFAKAYLGMFYDIDSNITPEARIYLLVDEEMVVPITSGLRQAVQQQRFPSPVEIAEAMGDDEQLGIGYIALAGMDLFLHQQGQVEKLSAATLKAVICFHYANSTYHQDDWLLPLLKQAPALAAEAYIEFWQVLCHKGITYLPGLQVILEKDELLPLRDRVIVAAVSLMRNKRPKELARMLLAALKTEATQALYETACEVLQQPEAIGIRQQVYWQATAFILEPGARGNILSGFVGQEKIKILPLLDFINWVLQDNPQRLSGEAIGELIRIIAPKFTPQKDNYGNLSDITLKVAGLFYLLAINPTLPATQVTKKLRRVRVLKLYNEVLDEVEALQTKLATEELNAPPDAETFIQQLHTSGKLKSKKKWSDTNY
jgi:hypothetical protein